MSDKLLLWEDVRSLARALLAHPPHRRGALATQICQGARRARRYAQVTGRCHPRWGNGTVDAAARRCPLATEPFLSDPEYRSCLRLALQQFGAPDVDQARGE